MAEPSASHAPYHWRNWWSFFVLGAINNLGYVVILSGAKSLADAFQAQKWIGAINWADVGLSFVARAANTYLVDILSFAARVHIVCTLLTVGLIGVAVSPHVSFLFLLLSITVLSFACAMGESCLLGYLKAYPASMTGGWSSGTGMAGVAGSALYLLFHAMGLSNEATFWLMVPTILLYWGAFFGGLKKPPNDDPNARRGKGPTPSSETEPDTEPRLTGAAFSKHALSVQSDAADGAGGGAAADDGGDPEDAREALLGKGAHVGETTWARLKRCTRMGAWYGVNLMLVYFFEYVISVGLASQANADDAGVGETGLTAAMKRNAYPVLAFAYQFGVLISRSSLEFVRVKRIQVLTVVQALNFVVWLLHDEYDLFGIWTQVLLMTFVGLLGGAMYVNAFALLVEDPDIPDVDRELTINLVAIFNTVGIVSASVFDIVMDHTFLVPKVH